MKKLNNLIVHCASSIVHQSKTLTLLLVMLMSVNVWGADYFTDNLAASGSSSVSSRTGWTSLTNIYAHYNSAIRLGTSNKSGSITKTAMTDIGKTPTNIKVSFAAAKWSSDATGLKITVNNAGKIDGSTTYTISKDDLRGETSTTGSFTFQDNDYFEVTITGATSSTTIKFETTATKRVLLGNVKISPASTKTTVYFDLNGGSGTKPADITEFPATLPSTDGFTRSGYRPNGWNTKNDGTGTHSDSGASGFTTSESVTLYVDWIPVYTVTYNGNNKTSGSVPVDGNSPYDKNRDVTVLGNTGNLARTGYTWSGWNGNTSGTGTEYVVGNSFKITSNTTLYAKWTANQTIITLSAPNADISQGTTQVTATYDKAMPTATMPQRTGYTFNGYFDAESGGTMYYSNTGASAKTWNKDVAEFILHAQWTAKQYTITYKNQGNTDFIGTHETGYPKKHTYDQETSLKTATRNGYIFEGWYENQDCSGSPIETIGGQAKTENFTLYAKWTARTTTVSFDKNAGDDEVQNMPAGTIVNTFDAALTTAGVTIPSRIGYTFVGWFDSSSKKYYGVTNEAILPSVNKWDKTDESITLSAHWEAITYNISYLDENGAKFSGSMSGLKTTHTYDTPTDLGVGSKTGYTFKGWFTDAACTSPISILGARDYTGPITIFAKWEEIIPTFIELSIEETTITCNAAKEVDNQIKVTSKVYPEDALQDVSWSAGGSSFAKVTNYQGTGTITGLADGDAIITCKAKNHPEVAATVTVHVTHIPILTWKDANGDVVATTIATALNGGKVTMPTAAQEATAKPCSDDYKLFYGWSATPISNPTETAPTLVTSATDAPEDHTYYAVFRNKEPKAEGYKITTTLTAGKTYIFGAVKAAASSTLANNTTFGAVAFKTAYTSTSWGQTVDLTPDANGFIAATNTSITDECKWTLEKIEDGNYHFKKGNIYVYLHTGTSSNSCGTSSSAQCFLEDKTSVCKDAFMLHPTSSSSNFMLYNTGQNGYRMYSSATFSKTMAPYFRFYEYQAADASGIKYITQCCTPLDAPAGGTATNVTATSATISWNTITNATGYQYKIGDGDWSTSSTNTSVSLTDLNPGTTYTVYLRANGTGTNCEEGTETSFPFTTLYTITATVNNEDFGTAQVSLDNTNWSNQVEAAPGTAIYVKATNNSSYSFSIWSVEEGGAGSFDAQTSSTTFTTGAANTTIKATFLANVKVLDYITITAPTKTDYLEGEYFDPSGMTITAYWEDGTSSPLLINDVTIEPNVALTPDDTKVTFSYTYDNVTKTADQTITVTPVYTVNWYVNGEAVKTIERVAEGTTYASLEKPATPSDGALSKCEANKFMGWATALITKDDATEADFNAIKLNETTATISNTCKEFHAVFAKEEDGGSVTPVIVSSTFKGSGSGGNSCTSGYNLTLTKTVDESGYIQDKASANEQIVIKVLGTNAIFSVAQEKIEIKATLGGGSAKDDLTEASQVYCALLDKNGNNISGSQTVLTKKITSKDGSEFSVEIPTSSTSSAYGFTIYHTKLASYNVRYFSASLTTTPVSISYSNFITTCKDVKGIAVQTAPTKVDYTEEETLDLTGLVVRVTYDDDSYLDITSGFTTNPANGAMLTNETEVTITYKEKTCEQAITINPLPRKTITAAAPDGGTYTVKVGNGEAQTISAATTITDVIAGRTITMTSTADDQHQLHSTPFVLTVAEGDVPQIHTQGENRWFTMPNSNVTITAKYVQTYTITSATGLVGGTVGTDKAKTSQGSKVNVTVSPNPGYNVTKVFYVKEGESAETEIEFKDDKYSFFMPASNVTVSAEFEAIKYTITLNDKGNITLKENLLYNDNVDLPALTPCYGYAFEGWTATEPTDGAWVTKPTIVNQVTVTDDATFYAVYSQGGGELPTNNYKLIGSGELESGKKYVIASKYDYTLYAINNTFYAGNLSSYIWPSFGGTAIYPTNGIIENATNNYVWTIEGNEATGYTLKNDKYIGMTDTYNEWPIYTANVSEAMRFAITFPNENDSYNPDKNVSLQWTTSDEAFYPYFNYSYYNATVSEYAGTNYLYKQIVENSTSYTAQPECKTLDETLIIEKEPKTIYKKGETFDKTGIEVWATFDSETDLADVTEYIEVDETTPLTMDDTKVTVSYTQDDVTATADQPVYVVDFTSLEVKSAKNTYTEGASFDMSKLVLNAVYSSTSHDKTLKEVVTSGITVEPNRALTTSDNKVTITYNGKSVDYVITVSETQPFTVTFWAGTDSYEVTEAAKSAGVRVPSVTNCGDYTFVGWSKDKLAEEESYTPVSITDGIFYPNENMNLYAVYSYLDGGDTYNRVTDLSTIANGDKVMFYNEYYTKFIAGSNTGTYGCAASAQPVGQNEQTVTMVDENTVWKVSKNGSNYQFAHGDKLMGVANYASTGSSVTLSLNSTHATWNLRASTSNTDFFILYQTSSSSGYAHQVNYYNSNWSLFHNDQADSYKKSFMIFKQGGTQKYTAIPTCDVKIEKYDVLLYAGSGTVTEDAYTLLKGESMTLPTPTFSITDWSFYGWAEDEIKRETNTTPTIMVNPFTPTQNVDLNAIYRRPVGNGYVYKTYPSTLQRPSFSPEVGTYDEAKDVTITAGEGATIYYRKTTDELHHVMNSNYDATVDGAMPYSSAIKTSTTTYIVAVAQYGDKFSDEEMYKIDFNYPAAPTFSVETGSNIFKGQSVTITAPEGTLLRYKVNGGEAVELATNTYVYTFKNEVDNITLTAYSEKSGLKSEEVSATYHILPVPNKVTFHAGTGLIDGESTKEIYEDAAGQGLILPVLDAPCTNGDSWKFYGWAKATVDATTSTPTILKEGDSDCSYTAQGLRFYPKSDCDLYAVYTKTTGIVELINEDFAEFNTTSGSDNFPFVSEVYSDDTEGGIRIGKSAGTGYIMSKTLNIPANSLLNISFDYKAWKGNKYADIEISETTNSVTFTGAGYTEYTHVTKSLTTTEANPQIKFATKSNEDNRAFIDNVVITMGTPVQNYATNPECCVRTISFNTDGGEAIEPIAVPCGTGNFVALPEAQKQNCNFINWTMGDDDYQVGDIYEMSADATEDVIFTAVFSEPITKVEITSEKIASEVFPFGYSGDVVVKITGKLTMDQPYSIRDFYIETAQGQSGQVVNAQNLTINGDAYMDYTLSVTGATAANQWHNFSVPFPVDVISGVYGYKNNAWIKLANEVDYAIEDYHGDIRANGQYGWKKFRGTMQPGVTYSMTVNGDIQTFRFKKTAGTFTPEESPRFSYIAYTGTGENTDKGWNGCGNKKLNYTTISGNNFGNKVQVLNASNYTYETKTTSEIVFTVGSAFFVQASSTGDNGFADAASATENLYAPIRRVAKDENTELKVTISNAEFTDNLYISASEEALNTYEIGHDLSKMFATMTPKAPMLWTTNYNGTKLSSEYAPLVNEEAIFALSLYAPKAGTYTLAIDNAQKNATVYLMQNGAIIWNLSQGAYEMDLAKGTNNEYTLVMKVDKSDVITGSDVINTQADGIQKFIYDEKLILIHNGNVYNGAGARMK